MLIEISSNDNIFESKPFSDEEVRFNLLQLIRNSEKPCLYSNENNTIIIGQSSIQYPVWVWTDDKISMEDMEALKLDFSDLFKGSERLSLVAKPEISKQLAEYYSRHRKINYRVFLQMKSFHCPKIIEPKVIDGYLDRPSEGDKEVIGEFISGFVYDCFGRKTDREWRINAAESCIKQEDFYVWRKDNEIIAMANIAHKSQHHARIDEVYTRPDMRRKGFAAMLVAEICKIIHKENRVPMLFTDATNPASNKAYKNIGFTECGELTQISFDNGKGIVNG